jgi:hypothetical protein
MVFILFLFAVESSNGQGHWLMGPTVGPHYSSSYIEHTIYRVNLLSRPIKGLHGGLMFQYFPDIYKGSLKTGLRMSINFTEKGWDQEYLDTLNTLQTVRTKMDYLNIPIESIFYVGSQKSKAYLLLGIYVDPQDKSKKTDFWTFDPQRDKSFGYGGKCGLGYQRKMGFGQLSLEAYITYGFSNIMFTIDRSTDIPDMSNHWDTGLSLSYLIPLMRNKFN